jgi:cell division protein FtsB
MDTKWLSDLEQKVQAVAEELESLRKENRSQKTHIKRLQEQLSQAAKAGPSAGDWKQERAQIRQRVERLASGLEKLLEG